MARFGTFLLLALMGGSIASPASASSVALLTPGTLFISGDTRVGSADGERSWTDGGFGKLRNGDGTSAPLGNADLVWQPQLGWLLSATVVASAQGGKHSEVGISEAYLTVRPRPAGPIRTTVRAGLIWVPLSLEHGGPDWHVLDTITPSAVNSWVGEELLPATVQGNVEARVGLHRLTFTAAAFAANDTAGALLTFRGWALHDRRTLAGRSQPLPPLADEIAEYQPRYTHPLLDVKTGFARRPGYYAKLAWEPPLPFRLELLRYDNRGDPAAANENREWAWRTRFSHIGTVVRLGGDTRLTAQALTGRTRMGLEKPTGIWIDNRFRSAFALLSRQRGPLTLAGRVEAFGTRQRGSVVTSDESEHGWAATLAAKRALGSHLTAAAEMLHVDSRRESRLRAGDRPHQPQTQLQLMLRASW